MTIRAVYWDMDGTLIDSEQLHTESLVAALRSLGLTPPSDLHERVLGITALDVHQMACEEWGLDMPFDEWIVLKYAFYLENAPDLKPRPGAIAIYHELRARGVVQAVVSNSDRLVVDANMKALNIQRAGMRSISRNDVRQGKPHPEPYLRAAWLTGIDPTETVVVEDSLPGALAGLAAGMTTIFWPEFPQTTPDGALTANSAEEVWSLIEARCGFQKTTITLSFRYSTSL